MDNTKLIPEIENLLPQIVGVSCNTSPTWVSALCFLQIAFGTPFNGVGFYESEINGETKHILTLRTKGKRVKYYMFDHIMKEINEAVDVLMGVTATVGLNPNGNYYIELFIS